MTEIEAREAALEMRGRLELNIVDRAPVKAIQRWLQLVSSLTLLDVFAEHTRASGVPMSADLLDEGALRLDFGDDLADAAIRVHRAQNSAPLAAEIPAPTPTAPTTQLEGVIPLAQTLLRRFGGTPDEPEPGGLFLLGQDIVGPVAHAFSFIDGVYERQQRDKLQSMPRAVLDRKSRELDRGVSLGELVDLIGAGDSGYWGRVLASFALDVCNDVGIAVPVTVVVDSRVSRQYRFGENAYLAGFPFGKPGRYKSSIAVIDVNVVIDSETWLVSRLRSETAHRRESAPGMSDTERNALIEYATGYRKVAAEAIAAYRSVVAALAAD
jgi:hypothetical protein